MRNAVERHSKNLSATVKEAVADAEVEHPQQDGYLVVGQTVP
jgi:hypothetical protein